MKISKYQQLDNVAKKVVDESEGWAGVGTRGTRGPRGCPILMKTSPLGALFSYSSNSAFSISYFLFCFVNIIYRICFNFLSFFIIFNTLLVDYFLE